MQAGVESVTIYAIGHLELASLRPTFKPATRQIEYIQRVTTDERVKVVEILLSSASSGSAQCSALRAENHFRRIRRPAVFSLKHGGSDHGPVM